MDERAKKLANIVVDYSVYIKAGDHLIIFTEPKFGEFADCIKNKAADKGAIVTRIYKSLERGREMIERNDHEEMKDFAEERCVLYRTGTAEIAIDASTDRHYLEGIDPKKIADWGKLVTKPVNEIVIGNGKDQKGYKWNLVGYPCVADAKEADMSLEEYADFLYGATNIDWSATSEKMKKVKGIFDNARDVHIIVPGYTDIHLSLEGRGGGVCDGKYNMPDGEVFYGPVEDSAEGFITFPYESVTSGQSVTNIKLEYKNGKVVSFSAEKNQEFLEAMLNLDGVKKLGEFGIGCNYGIERYVKNLLFDEKIGGTIHLALGESYKEPLGEGGGKNDADIHWDLVCELRKIDGFPGGEIYVDGNLVQKNGVWTF